VGWVLKGNRGGEREEKEEDSELIVTHSCSDNIFRFICLILCFRLSRVDRKSPSEHERLRIKWILKLY